MYENKGHMGGMSELNFNGDFTWAAQLQGRSDAQAALTKASNSVNVKDHFVEWLENEDLQAAFPQIGDFLQSKRSEELFPDAFLV